MAFRRYQGHTGVKLNLASPDDQRVGCKPFVLRHIRHDEEISVMGRLAEETRRILIDEGDFRFNKLPGTVQEGNAA
ncbi:MAG: hypothetical protein ABI955_01330 [Nitrospirota bacterium]